jgi:hypothetical protein
MLLLSSPSLQSTVISTVTSFPASVILARIHVTRIGSFNVSALYNDWYSYCDTVCVLLFDHRKDWCCITTIVLPLVAFPQLCFCHHPHHLIRLVPLAPQCPRAFNIFSVKVQQLVQSLQAYQKSITYSKPEPLPDALPSFPLVEH